MKRLILIIVISFISLNLFATAQRSDYLIYKGDTLRLLTNPLESYFKAHNLKFRDLSSVGEFSSACWRGYIAYFEIKNESLYVVDVCGSEYYREESGEYRRKLVSVMDSVFPNQKEYLLKEYSGVLRIPIGEVKNYVHMGYSSEYESYTFIEIEKGKVLAEKFLTNEEYNLMKEAQYREYIKTDEFKNEVTKLMKESKEEKLNIDFYIEFLYMFFEPKIGVREAQLDFGGLSE